MGYWGAEPSNRDLFSFIKRLERNQNEVVEAHNRLERKMSEGEQKQILTFVKEMQVRNYEGSRSYTRVVIAVGYASFFTLWSGLKDDLQQMTLLSAGLCMTISVILFMSSEVHNMICSQFHFRRINEMLIQQPSQENIKKINEADFQFADSSQKIWLGFLSLTIFTAVLGAIFLLASFVFGIYDELLLELQY